MGECEICGKRSENLSYVNIEGTTFKVCQNCSSLGEKITTNVPSTPKKSSFTRDNERKEVLVSNCGNVIAVGRQKKGFKQEELANKLSEKLSEIKAIETGKRIPTIKLAKKLEKILEIKLIEEDY